MERELGPDPREDHTCVECGGYIDKFGRSICRDCAQVEIEHEND